MPRVLPPAKVLVTGANGYLGTWIVRTLLERGYAVRGAVRNEAKAGFLKDVFAGYEGLQVAVTGDLLAVMLCSVKMRFCTHCSQEGGFDEAVNGVDVVVHTASPVVLGMLAQSSRFALQLTQKIGTVPEGNPLDFALENPIYN
jgi:nucleoside-diphosphate-sugar epimerase